MTKARDLARVGSNAEYGLNFRNRIINGDMRIDQRNAGASVTVSGGEFSVDRWKCRATNGSKYSAQQNAGSVTPPTGFTNYLGITSLSAYSILSSNFFMVVQNIEGFNTADLGWGTGNAKTVTLSFWVRSSLTGTFGGSLQNSAANRSYPFAYTISAANTWEYKTITVAGDTTGTWIGSTNGTGLTINLGLGVGTDKSGTAGAWAASEFFSATGATSVVGTNGATFYLTGVQLEVGSSATPFETRPYGTELALCQRYFWSSFAAVGATPSGWGANFVQSSGIQGTTTTGMIEASFICQVPMRAAPTGSVWDHVGTAGKTSSFNPNSANYSGESGYVNSTSPYIFKLQRISGNASSAIGAYVQLSAEL